MKRLEKSVRLSMDFETMSYDILAEIQKNIRDADSLNISNLINTSFSAKRIPIVYFYEHDVPLTFQLISSDNIYKKYVDFITYEYPSKEIMKNFQIKKLPALVMVNPDPENPGK